MFVISGLFALSLLPQLDLCETEEGERVQGG